MLLKNTVNFGFDELGINVKQRYGWSLRTYRTLPTSLREEIIEDLHACQRTPSGTCNG